MGSAFLGEVLYCPVLSFPAGLFVYFIYVKYGRGYLRGERMNTICFHAMRGAGGSSLCREEEEEEEERKKTRVGSSCGSENEQP